MSIPFFFFFFYLFASTNYYRTFYTQYGSIVRIQFVKPSTQASSPSQQPPILNTHDFSVLDLNLFFPLPLF